LKYLEYYFEDIDKSYFALNAAIFVSTRIERRKTCFMVNEYNGNNCNIRECNIFLCKIKTVTK